MTPLRAADLFCGAGGSSTGLLRACDRLGRPVKLLAVNHWREAIETHALNHPGVHHLHEDLAAIDPRKAMAEAGLGTTLDLLWASPECTSHSYSRGGRPISEQSRATAWHPLKWCDQLNVKAFIVENVPSFRAWGPSDRLGRPVRARRGETYQQYLAMFRALGYTVEARVLNAADFGAAQTRRRLFIVGIKGARPIRWPAPTHGPAGSLLFGLQPYRAAREIIDWSLPGKSIFNRKKPHARKTLERILIGGEKYWPALRPFLPILRNHLLPRSVDEPIPTVAARGTHIGLAEPVLIQVSHGDNPPGSGRGNGGRVRSVAEPLGTLTGSRELGVAQPLLVGTEFTQGNGNYVRTVDEPLGTLTSRGGIGVADPFVLVNRTGNRPRSLEDPLACLNGGNHLGLVAPILLPQRTFENMAVEGRDLLRRQRPQRVVDPVVEPVVHDAGPGVLIPFNGEGPGQVPRTHSIDAPLPTITTGGAGQKGLAQSLLLKYSRSGGPRSLETPLDTLTAKPRYGVITPELAAAVDACPVGSVTPLGLKIAPGLYLDILFRMLRVHELGQGQGFPPDYRFTGNLEEQIKQVGNAVEVHQAEALCWAVLA